MTNRTMITVILLVGLLNASSSRSILRVVLSDRRASSSRKFVTVPSVGISVIYGFPGRIERNGSNGQL